MRDISMDRWEGVVFINTVHCDNNLTAASYSHFDKVIDRLVKWGWADFNQGLDSRLLTAYHAERIHEIKKPIIRLALDSMFDQYEWLKAVDVLRSAGIFYTTATRNTIPISKNSFLPRFFLS